MREIKASENTGPTDPTVNYGYLVEDKNGNLLEDGLGCDTEAEAIEVAIQEVNCYTDEDVQVVGYVLKIERIAKVVP